MTFTSYRHHHKKSLKQANCELCRREHEQHTTHEPLPSEGNMMEKLSDLIGSVRGIFLLGGVEAVYMVLATVFGFDAYPFAFLTLVLSLIALQFSQIIIVVQNRQGAVLEEKAAKERAEVEEDLSLDKRSFALLVDLHDRMFPDVKPTDVVDVPEAVVEQRKTST